VNFLINKEKDHSLETRKKQAMRILKISKWIEHQQIVPVISIIHPVEEDRMYFAEELYNNYQVYLECNLDTCRQRYWIGSA